MSIAVDSCPQCKLRASITDERARDNAEFLEKLATLSDREREVLVAMCLGSQPTGIAKRLKIAVKTVSTYRARIQKKLQLRSNTQMAIACERAGLLE